MTTETGQFHEFSMAWRSRGQLGQQARRANQDERVRSGRGVGPLGGERVVRRGRSRRHEVPGGLKRAGPAPVTSVNKSLLDEVQSLLVEVVGEGTVEVDELSFLLADLFESLIQEDAEDRLDVQQVLREGYFRLRPSEAFVLLAIFDDLRERFSAA